MLTKMKIIEMKLRELYAYTGINCRSPLNLKRIMEAVHLMFNNSINKQSVFGHCK